MILDHPTLSALTGGLKARTSTTVTSSDVSNVMVQNALPLAVVLLLLDGQGDHVGWTPTSEVSAGEPPLTAGAPGIVLRPSMGSRLPTWIAGGYVVVLTSATGAFVGVLGPLPDATASADFLVSADLLLAPHAIGPMPVPSGDTLLPPDSPRVVVGCGQTPKGTVVVREQFWQRLADSSSLAPNEVVTTSTTTTTGMQDTTSTSEEVASSLGVSASGGWGAISASVSASLSLSSSSFQQVTVTSQTTTYNVSEIDNNPGDSSYLLLWQLTDILTFLDSSDRPVGSVVSAIPPVIVAKHPGPSVGGPALVVPELEPGRYRLTASAASATATQSFVVSGPATLEARPSITAPASPVALVGEGFPAGATLAFAVESTPSSAVYVSATVSPSPCVVTSDGTLPDGTVLTLAGTEPGEYAIRATAGAVAAWAVCVVPDPSLSIYPRTGVPGTTVSVGAEGMPPVTSVSFRLVGDDGVEHDVALTCTTTESGQLSKEQEP